MMMNEFAGTVRSQKRGSILFAAAVLLLVCVLAVGAVSADEVMVSNFTELRNNITSGSDDLTIIVTGNFSITDELTINSGNITLTTNDAEHTLSRDNSFTGNLFTMSGGNLTITGNLTQKTNLTLDGMNQSSSGSLVYVDGGNFTLMDGGILTNNTVPGINGGGVYVDNSGTFTMSGGEISKNKANNGGGVYGTGGSTFTMERGTISDNEAYYGYGGGVFVGNGEFTMSGGTISGNTANLGGGVDMYSGTFTMSGGTISGNTANLGGGVYVSSSTTFTMKTGEISGNTASYSGGGVYLNSGTFEMERGTISDNTANGDGGGVYVGYNGEFEMSSGTISDNTANGDGGGVYVIGIFELSGSSSVDGVYLTLEKVINVTGELTGTGPQVTDINLQSPVHGTKVVTISPSVPEPNYLNYFQLNASLERFELEYQNLNIVLKQQYCIVSFDAQGGTPATDEQFVQYGNTVSDPAPTWEGHTLEGWYTENTCQNKWNFSDPVTRDMTLYANWTLNTYTVSFDTQGGSTVPAQTVSHGGKATEPADPTKNGFTFTNWYNESACLNLWDFTTDTVTDDMTLYAKWTPNKPSPEPPSGGSSSDGNMDNAYRVLFNDGATTLYGWHKDSACTQAWDFNDGITGSMTLYAKWTPQETVTPTATATVTPTVTATTTITSTPTGDASPAPTSQPDTNGNSNTNGETTATSGISLPYLIGGIAILLLAILLLLFLLLRHTVTFLIPTGGELEEYRIKVWHGRYINTEDLPALIRTAAWYRDPARQERWDFDQDRVKKSIELYIG